MKAEEILEMVDSECVKMGGRIRSRQVEALIIVMADLLPETREECGCSKEDHLRKSCKILGQDIVRLNEQLNAATIKLEIAHHMHSRCKDFVNSYIRTCGSTTLFTEPSIKSMEAWEKANS